MAALPPPPPPPPPSTTITVTESHDYRGQTLNNIDSIVFQTTDFANATFNAIQFGSGRISDTVQINGDDHQNFIDVNLITGSSFSAAGWTFSNWVPFTPLQNDQVNITGSDSADTITGSSQADGLIGNDGDDALNGGDGRDFLIGGVGIDTLTGGAGDDDYRLEDVHLVGDLLPRFFYDTVIEDAGGGIDTVLVQRVGIVGGYTLGANVENGFIVGTETFSVFGNELDNRLTGNDAANVLSGGTGADTLLGQGGDDTLFGGDGNDFLDGGTQIDTASYASASASVSVNLANLGSQDTGGAGIDVLSFVENLVGSAFSDRLSGNDVANVLSGGDRADALRGRLGNDTLIGGLGNDRLNGGAGSDGMTGEDGRDTYFVDDSLDVVVEAAGGAIDTVIASVTRTLGAEQEILILSGTAAINGRGNELANRLTGNAAVNGLNGLAGADRIAGGRGNDLLTGGGGEDSFLFDTALNAAANVDVVTDYSVASDTIRLENSVFTGLSGGAFLKAAQFHVGTAATSASQRVIYNDANGNLFFDVDGLGGAAQIRFAKLDAGLTPTNLDFFVV